MAAGGSSGSVAVLEPRLTDGPAMQAAGSCVLALLGAVVRCVLEPPQGTPT